MELQFSADLPLLIYKQKYRLLTGDAVEYKQSPGLQVLSTENGTECVHPSLTEIGRVRGVSGTKK